MGRVRPYATHATHGPHATVLYCDVSMPSESRRNWSRTYAAVIVTEILTLIVLWWLQSHYGV